MADKPLEGVRVAIVCATDLERSELDGVREALYDAGAETVMVSGGEPAGYDALLVPSGELRDGKLSVSPEAQPFVRHFRDRGKPMGALVRDHLRQPDWEEESMLPGEDVLVGQEASSFQQSFISMLARHRAREHQRPLAETVQEYVGAEDLKDEMGGVQELGRKGMS